MKLVYEKTGQLVGLGDKVQLGDSEYSVVRISEPYKPSSTGRVYIRPFTQAGGGHEYFPSVIGAKWIDRTDQF